MATEIKRGARKVRKGKVVSKMGIVSGFFKSMPLTCSPA